MDPARVRKDIERRKRITRRGRYYDRINSKLLSQHKMAKTLPLPDGPEPDWFWVTMGDDIMDAYSARLWSEHHARMHQQGVLELFIELTAREVEERTSMYTPETVSIVSRTALEPFIS